MRCVAIASALSMGGTVCMFGYELMGAWEQTIQSACPKAACLEQGVLAIEGGVDVSDADTLTPQLFNGVVQVVHTVGPVFGKLQNGSMGCARASILVKDIELLRYPHTGWPHAVFVHQLDMALCMCACSCRYVDGMTSERVDGKGTTNIVAAMKANLKEQVWIRFLASGGRILRWAGLCHLEVCAIHS